MIDGGIGGEGVIVYKKLAFTKSIIEKIKGELDEAQGFIIREGQTI